MRANICLHCDEQLLPIKLEIKAEEMQSGAWGQKRKEQNYNSVSLLYFSLELS